jgi:sarcosine oxidase
MGKYGMKYDVIVIGVGGMGSAAVSISSENGSSHGVNRIIGLAYPERPGYVPVLRRAYELLVYFWNDPGEDRRASS